MSRWALVVALASPLSAAPAQAVDSAAIHQQSGSSVEAPTSLTDAEFWDFFSTNSEPSGNFLSDNFVSNERYLQDVIPTLQHSLTKDGVYIGVGPEQNFTYIATLKPRLAVIVDIRRQNALQHLMYKALFEMSATRVEFVERLFSRPMPATLASSSTAQAIFEAVRAASPTDSMYKSNRAAIIRRLNDTHHFALSAADIASIEHVFAVFHEAGPDVNYGYRFGQDPTAPTPFPTFDMTQTATDAVGVASAFLATEDNYLAVRNLQMRNLVIPLVGDFAGPKAIRAVGEYLTRHRMTVTAFYVSNVEQYLFQQGDASTRFYANVASLPTDSTSQFIRTFSPNLAPHPLSPDPLRASRDSAWQQFAQSMPDIANLIRAAGPPLVQGLAGMRLAVDAWNRGDLLTYRSAIAMTRATGWR